MVDLNQAVFAWCLRNLERCSGPQHVQEALKWSRLAALAASSHGFGELISPDLEAVLIRIAETLPTPSCKSSRSSFAPKRWLHILSEAHPIGGHTALVTRWIRFDDTDNVHSVILLRQGDPIPFCLSEAVKEKCGHVVQIDPRLPLLDAAQALRKVAWSEADIVLLHIHPDDVIPTVAFGVPGGPPVLYLNHADHLFWVGGSVADLVINIRDSTLEWTQQYRGIKRNSVLPIPIETSLQVDGRGRVPQEEREAARIALNLPREADILLTIGSSYKYVPLPGLNFLEAAKAILHARPNAYLIGVGPLEDESWRRIREITGGRLVALGPQCELKTYHAAADIYLEGFPCGSLTALLEAGILGIPCVRAPRGCPPPFCSDGAALEGIAQPNDVGDYVRQVVSLLDNLEERTRRGVALSAAIKQHHSRLIWRKLLKTIENNIPEFHSVGSLGPSRSVPEEYYRFCAAFSCLALNGKGVVSSSFDSAFGLGLHPKLDFRLWKAIRAAGWAAVSGAELKKVAFDKYGSENFKLARKAAIQGFIIAPTRLMDSELLFMFIKSLLGSRLLRRIRWIRNSWSSKVCRKDADV